MILITLKLKIIDKLNLNKGIAYVNYEYKNIKYSREYFTSYPDKVMVIRLSASKNGALSFTLRPTIPYISEGKSGVVSVKNDLIALSGVMSYYNIKFEGQFNVIPDGGKMKAKNDGTIIVSDANSAVVLIAIGTNYQIESQMFLTKDATKKLEGFHDPHDKVSSYIEKAEKKTYEELLGSHMEDYTGLYSRVSFSLGGNEPDFPTNI